MTTSILDFSKNQRDRSAPNTVAVLGVVVRRYQIIDTRWLVYKVFEPAQGHTEVTYNLEGAPGKWGEITSSPVPNLEAHPVGSAERIEAVEGWKQACIAQALFFAKEAFPEDADEIELFAGCVSKACRSEAEASAIIALG